MKKNTIIAIGITFLIIIIVVWVYLFVFGKPESSEEVFANFGIGEVTEIPAQPGSGAEGGGNAGDASSVRNALRKLTDRPVAGATFVDNTTVRFAEQGTGHIYDIDISTDREEKVSNTTFSEARAAVFSSTGGRVALTNNGGEVFAGTITKNDEGIGVVDDQGIARAGTDVAFSDTGEGVFYVEHGRGMSVGYAYNLTTRVRTELFSLPLRDISVVWGQQGAEYVYTKPSAVQYGSVYALSGNSLTWVAAPKPGLMADTLNDALLLSWNSDDGLSSTLRTEGAVHELPLGVFPRKCAAETGTSSPPLFFCAAPLFYEQNVTFPDDWYKGVVSLTDALWQIDVARGEATLLVDLGAQAGESIDIDMIRADANDRVIFRDKVGGALWIYDPSLE